MNTRLSLPSNFFCVCRGNASLGFLFLSFFGLSAPSGRGAVKPRGSRGREEGKEARALGNDDSLRGHTWDLKLKRAGTENLPDKSNSQPTACFYKSHLSGRRRFQINTVPVSISVRIYLMSRDIRRPISLHEHGDKKLHVLQPLAQMWK